MAGIGISSFLSIYGTICSDFVVTLLLEQKSAKMRRIKDAVKLRRRMLGNGDISLYLDTYSEGRREYEFLKLYLVPERTADDRRRNRDTLALAEEIRARRSVELRNRRWGVPDTGGGDIPLLDYCRRYLSTRKAVEGFLRHITLYVGKRKTTVADVDRRFVLGFRAYLATAAINRNTGELLSDTSRAFYFTRLRSVMNCAVKDGIVDRTGFEGVDGFRTHAAERAYLTSDELRRMAETPCRHGWLRRAFLFSCLSGLRKSDIAALRWGEVRVEGGFTRIVFRQRKTSGLEYLDLSPDAAALLGQRPAGASDADLCFADFRDDHCPAPLREWTKAAGITKHITFHSGRHTFAVLLIAAGVDIYTVQKLLGHRDISTTQIYAALLDTRKREAVCLLPRIL